MKKIKLKAGGFELSYIEVNPEGVHTLFLIHGNSGSSEIWKHQFNDEKLKQFRMISIDLPGHGDSNRTSDPYEDFKPFSTASILSKAIQTLVKNGEPFSVAGFSYGANLLAELLNFEKNILGLVLFGSSVIGKDIELGQMLIDPASSIYFKEGLEEKDVSDFISSRSRATDKEMNSIYVNAYLKTQAGFRSTLFQHAVEQNYSDELALLRDHSSPLLLVFGKEDNLVNPDYLDHSGLSLWEGKIHKLENAGHYVHSDLPAQCNGLMARYLSEFLK